MIRIQPNGSSNGDNSSSFTAGEKFALCSESSGAELGINCLWECFSIDFLSGLFFISLSWWNKMNEKWGWLRLTRQVAFSCHKSGFYALGNVLENNSPPSKWSYSIDLPALSRFYARVKSWILVCTLSVSWFELGEFFNINLVVLMLKKLEWNVLSAIPLCGSFANNLSLIVMLNCKTRNKWKVGFVWGHSKCVPRPKNVLGWVEQIPPVRDFLTSNVVIQFDSCLNIPSHSLILARRSNQSRGSAIYARYF